MAVPLNVHNHYRPGLVFLFKEIYFKLIQPRTSFNAINLSNNINNNYTLQGILFTCKQ